MITIIMSQIKCVCKDKSPSENVKFSKRKIEKRVKVKGGRKGIDSVGSRRKNGGTKGGGEGEKGEGEGQGGRGR